MDWEFELDVFGIPDMRQSGCVKPKPCKGDARAKAEACLPHAPDGPDDTPVAEWSDNDCDPRGYIGILICDSSGPQPGFEGAEDLGREWAETCGRY